MDTNHARPGYARYWSIGLMALLLMGVVPASAASPGDPKLQVLAVELEPVSRGKNELFIKVQSTSATDELFAVHIYTRSPRFGRGMGWGTAFFESISPGETTWTRFVYKIQGPVSDDTWLRLRFYNPESIDDYDYDHAFLEKRYEGAELPRRERIELPREASRAQSEMAISTFKRFQDYLRHGRYAEAWSMLTRDFRQAEYQEAPGREKKSFENFVKSMDSDSLLSHFRWDLDDLLRLEPRTVLETDASLLLEAEHDDQAWTITLRRVGDQLKVDWITGYTPRLVLQAEWETRLLPAMKKKTTPHLDIYYLPGSTAERDIDRIAEQREHVYAVIADYLDVEPTERLPLVLFEDEATKRRETGQPGLGRAFGRTMVEVYNAEKKPEPYYETTNVLAYQVGDPPALFREGLAIYMLEEFGQPTFLQLQLGDDFARRAEQRLRELEAEGTRAGIEQLMKYSDLDLAGSDPLLAYAQARGFTRFLLERFGKDRFLQAYKGLEPARTADAHARNLDLLQQVYGHTIAELEQEWLASRPAP